MTHERIVEVRMISSSDAKGLADGETRMVTASEALESRPKQSLSSGAMAKSVTTPVITSSTMQNNTTATTCDLHVMD